MNLHTINHSYDFKQIAFEMPNHCVLYLYCECEFEERIFATGNDRISCDDHVTGAEPNGLKSVKSCSSPQSARAALTD